jgi:molybdopterin/thiamine biosynthesis adenylyltransferase/rhodanese-related sulfurtransferase/molybdopterin converting factor small subunit
MAERSRRPTALGETHNMATIRIPTPLRPLAGGADEVEVEGVTVRELLDNLETRHQGFRARLQSADGSLRHFVNLYVGPDDIRDLGGLDTELKDGDTVSIIPAIAGGLPDVRGLLAELRQRLSEVSAAEAARRLDAGDPRPLLLDVRERDEVEHGAVPGSVHIPRGVLEMRIETLAPDKRRPVIAYCAGGNRSLLAAESLERLGYTSVASLAGGFRAWQQAGLEWTKPVSLSAEQRRRYMRHLTMPEVGEEGQAKLLAGRVLLVGAGGLGSPAAFYLAAAGVGHLTIVDDDVVDETNLQRQILHTVDRIGEPKVDSARKTLLALNPGIEVTALRARINSDNVSDLVAAADVVLDGSDNFPTRYLVNDACVLHKTPCVHGSVYRFEGQVTVFWPDRGPCYRCLYPAPPPPELAPSCAEAGVLGVLPGVVGMLEAVEVIKILLGIGRPLTGRLLAYDALRASFHELKARRDPDCPYCSEGAAFPGFIDYELFCAAPGPAERATGGAAPAAEPAAAPTPAPATNAP